MTVKIDLSKLPTQKEIMNISLSAFNGAVVPLEQLDEKSLMTQVKGANPNIGLGDLKICNIDRVPVFYQDEEGSIRFILSDKEIRENAIIASLKGKISDRIAVVFKNEGEEDTIDKTGGRFDLEILEPNGDTMYSTVYIAPQQHPDDQIKIYVAPRNEEYNNIMQRALNSLSSKESIKKIQESNDPVRTVANLITTDFKNIELIEGSESFFDGVRDKIEGIVVNYSIGKNSFEVIKRIANERASNKNQRDLSYEVDDPRFKFLDFNTLAEKLMEVLSSTPNRKRGLRN